MPLPNFLIIGAPRAGTTTLYHGLVQHPEVFMSEEKEPNFFLFDAANVSFAGPGMSEVLERSSTCIEEYRRLFERSQGHTAVGESSTQYLYSAHAARRIEARIPEARLVVVLRDPIERAYSSYLHLRSLGEESSPTFEEALAREEQRRRDNWWPKYFYMEKGLYHQQLKPYTELFPPEQLRVYMYEDLSARLEDLLRDLFSYLGVDPTFAPIPPGRMNASGLPKVPWLHRLLTAPSAPKALAKTLLPGRVAEVVYERIHRMNLARPPMDPDTRERLGAYFRADTERLQDLLDRDLSAWLA